MTTHDVAKQLVLLLRKGEFETIYNDLYHAEKIHHIEPQSEHFADLKGVQALRDKDAMIIPNVEKMENLTIGDPIISGDYIGLTYKVDITLKDGTFLPMDEIIMYKVEDGKIVLEQFFY